MPHQGVYKLPRASGVRWRAFLDLGPDPETGKRRQVSKVFASEEAAYSWRVRELAKRQSRQGEPSRQRLSDYLEDWLADLVTIRQSSRNRYQRTIRNHLAPYLGDVPLAEISVERVERLQATLARSGLAPHTVNTALTLLSQALRRAVRWGRIERNPCDAVPGLPEPRKTRAVWSLADLRRFLTSASAEPQGAVWLLAAACGLRRGELLSLRWADLDLVAGTVTVTRSRTEDARRHIIDGAPKTDESGRQLGLPPSVISSLIAQRVDQRERQRLSGAAWVERDLVFDRGDGDYWSYNGYSLAFRRLYRTLDLPPMRPHDLRHRAATLMLGDAGIPDDVVSKVMGHASIVITHDIYGHLTDDQRRMVAERVEHVIWGDDGARAEVFRSV